MLHWRYQTGRIPIDGTPIIGSDGTIYIAALDFSRTLAGPLYALTPAGELRWRYWPRDPIVADPTLGPDGLLYVHLQSHYVQALDPASGELVQVHSGGNPGYTPVIDRHGTLYIGAKNDGLFAQPTAYGGTNWAFRTAGYVYASVLYDGADTVYAGSDDRFMGGDGRLYALSLDGTERWSCPIPAGVGFPPQLGPDETILIVSNLGVLLAIGEGGVERWQFHPEGGVTACPSVPVGVGARPRGDTVYVASGKGMLFALTAEGKVRWSLQVSDGTAIVAAPLVAEDGAIYVGTFNSQLRSLTPDGSLRWSIDVGGPILGSPMLTADGAVCLGTHDGRVLAIDTQGTERWSFRADAGMPPRCIAASPCFDSVVVADTAGNLYVTDSTRSRDTHIPTRGVVFALAQREDRTIIVLAPKRHVSAYTPGGELLWSRPSEHVGLGLLLGAGGEVLVGRKTILALSARGELLWEVELEADIGPSLSQGADGTIYACTDKGAACALSPGGRVRWSRRLSDWALIGSVACGNGLIYAGSMGGGLYALRGDGAEHREVALSGGHLNGNYLPLLLGRDDTVYAVTDGVPGVAAVGQDGTEKWFFPVASQILYSPAVGPDGSILVPVADAIVVLDPNGTLRASIPLPAPACSGIAIGVNGYIYVGTDDGYLNAVQVPVRSPQR